MQVTIEKMDDLGRGIGFIDGKITFVPKTTIGDVVEVEIIQSKKNYNEAKISKIIKESSDRIKSLCPYFDKCGGCDYQMLSYKKIIEYKKNRIINMFQKKGTSINPIFIENPYPLNYRNKITLRVVNGTIGYYEYGTHNIVEIDACCITSSAINKTISHIKNMNILNGEVVIRCNKNEEVLIAITSPDEIKIDVENIKKDIKLVGIVLNDKTIYGENFLYEMLNGILFKISYNSFFQVNPFIAEKLFQKVSDSINIDDTVLDIYCGVGTISLNAAKKAQKVIGIEIVPNAVLNAIFNAKTNKLNNTEFILNDASKAVEKIKGSFDKIIVDPPRSGLSKNVIDIIKKKNPQEVIYFSCDAQTLLRDIELLSDQYTIKEFNIYDMFSYTYHVESLLILERKSSEFK